MSIDKIPSSTSALEQQFNATVQTIWGRDWKNLVDQSSVDTFVDLIKEKKLPSEQLLSEAVKSVRLDDLHYFLALRAIIMCEEIAPEDKKVLQAEMQNSVEKFSLPRIADVLENANSLFTECNIEQPDPKNMPPLSDIYGPFLQAFLEPEEGYDAAGELAVMVRDLLRGLKKSVQKGNQADFFELHPEFWHFIATAKTLSEQST